MRRTHGNTGKSHRHPNYRKYRKRNDHELRRRRRNRNTRPNGGTMNWKIPYYADSTAAVIRHNWLLKVMGPNYIRGREEARADKASENYPDYITKRDQPDRRTR